MLEPMHLQSVAVWRRIYYVYVSDFAFHFYIHDLARLCEVDCLQATVYV